jgi:hypothetical protein
MPSSFELLYHEVLEDGLDLALWIQRTRRIATSAAT